MRPFDGRSSLPTAYRTMAVPAARRPAAVLAMGVGAMLGIFFARLTTSDGPDSGVTFLLALPVALIAHELGRTAGFLAALGALGQVVLWSRLRDVDLGLLAYASRGVIFGLVAHLGAQARGARAVAPVGDRPPAVRTSPLTPREREVLRLLAHGHTNRQVAEQLVVSVRTVEAHRASIQAKLSCSGRAELYRHAAGMNLLTR